MSKKIIRLPNTNWVDRKRNQVGAGFVPCEVSGRYLNIKSNGDSDYISIDVMTTDTKDNKDRKLTELIVQKSDLLTVLKNADIL